MFGNTESLRRASACDMTRHDGREMLPLDKKRASRGNAVRIWVGVDERRRGQVYVGAAALAWSTAGVLQRELSVGVATQVAGRAVFAAVALFVVVYFAAGREVATPFRSIGWAGVVVAALLAVSSSSFIIALNHAKVASVLVIQALAPVAAGAIGWVALGERVGLRAWCAMAVAVAGVAVMVGGPGGLHGVGLLLSFLMMISFAGSLVLTRHRRDVSMAPATCLSQAIVVLAAAPFADPMAIHLHDLALLIALGIGQVGLGFAFVTAGARLIPTAEVALITLLEVALGPLWVWLVLSERPGTATIAGGAIVILAVAVQASTRQVVTVPI
jgi:drug/metabolite transporter (DMT)-like permease